MRLWVDRGRCAENDLILCAVSNIPVVNIHVSRSVLEELQSRKDAREREASIKRRRQGRHGGLKSDGSLGIPVSGNLCLCIPKRVIEILSINTYCKWKRRTTYTHSHINTT